MFVLPVKVTPDISHQLDGQLGIFNKAGDTHLGFPINLWRKNLALYPPSTSYLKTLTRSNSHQSLLSLAIWQPFDPHPQTFPSPTTSSPYIKPLTGLEKEC